MLGTQDLMFRRMVDNMYIAVKCNLEDFDNITDYVIKKMKGKRQHVAKVSNFSFFSVNKVSNDDLEILNYFKSTKNAVFEILEYIIL